jgi:hypothetical protein
MDESAFEAKLRRLEAIAESYEAKMYEAPDLTTATGHYSNMKDFFYDAIGLARRAGRNDHVERLEKRLSELKQIFRDQLWFDGGRTGSRFSPPVKNAAEKPLKESQGDVLLELDVVEVIKLLRTDRPYTGTQAVCRPPRVGDTGTIVSVWNPETSDILYSVECVDKNGATVWLADFFAEELRRVVF